MAASREPDGPKPRFGAMGGRVIENVSSTAQPQAEPADRPGPLGFQGAALYPLDWIRARLGISLGDAVMRRCRVVSGFVWGESVIGALRELFGVATAPEESGPLTADSPPQEVLTVPEAAGMLRVSSRSLLRLVDAGEIGAVDLAPDGSAKRLLRFRRTEIEGWLAGQPGSTSAPHPAPKARLHVKRG